MIRRGGPPAGGAHHARRAASGVLTTVQNFASAAGVGILGSVFFAFLGSGTGLEAYTGSNEKINVIALVCVLITAGLAALIGRPEPVAASPEKKKVSSWYVR
jgi:hypothetical protein